MRLYCWFSNTCLQDATIQSLLIENKIMPICADALISREINYQIKTSAEDIIWEFTYKRFPFAGKSYYDEPYTTKSRGIELININEAPQVIYGETAICLTDRLVQQGAKNITYTAYKPHLFRVFNWFNMVWFGNQIPTWEKMERRYNIQDRFPYQYSYETPKETVKRVWTEDKFNYCWINLLSNRGDYAELLKWIKDHDKTCMITFGWHGWFKQTPQTVDEVRSDLIEFVKTLKQINGEK